MIETFKNVKKVNKVQEVSIFTMKLRSSKRGHDLKLAGGKFETKLLFYQNSSCA